MAKGQQGVGAITVWLIVFVFFWLVSTVWLVILYTGQEELRTNSARVLQSYRRVVTDEELRSIEMIKSASENGPTAVGILEEARSETARLATGDPKNDPPQVQTKRDELLAKIRRDRAVDDPDAYEQASLLDGFTTLYESYKKERSLRQEAEQRQAELDAQVARLSEEKNQEKANFDKMAQSLRDEMNTAEAQHSTYREERDDEVARIAKEFETRRSQTDADLTQERQQHRQAERQISEIRTRLAHLQETNPEVQIGPGPLSTARQPDGRILTAFIGDNVVYVDLGASDRLVLGLKFGVYSPVEGIPADGRAKAQIEVIAISELFSECRIRSVMPNEIILQGDLIANPIYDRARAPGFLVLGDFDLNRDGLPDNDGRATMEAVIVEWGGTLLDDVSALTDFVVVGASPQNPKPPRNPTPESTARYEVQQRAWNRYHETLQAAQSLAVPTMTQEVFLNFLGQPWRWVRR